VFTKTGHCRITHEPIDQVENAYLAAALITSVWTQRNEGLQSRSRQVARTKRSQTADADAEPGSTVSGILVRREDFAATDRARSRGSKRIHPRY
jgi:hypothetical protein